MDWKCNNRKKLVIIRDELSLKKCDLRQVDFPSVTICSPGMSTDNLESGFYKLFFAFLAANNVTINLSPYSAATILSKVWVFYFECFQLNFIFKSTFIQKLITF